MSNKNNSSSQSLNREWCSYGEWDNIAKNPSIEYVKEKIVGFKEWKTNAISPRLKDEFTNLHDKTCIDFGCGLGRNGPVLNQYFSRVVGVDLPEMLDRTKEIPEFEKHYAATYSSIQEALQAESILDQDIVVYESVVWQHWTNETNIHEVWEACILCQKCTHMYTMWNQHVIDKHYPFGYLLNSKKWYIEFDEVDNITFKVPHHGYLFKKIS